MRRFLQPIYTAYALVTFVASFLLAFPMIVLGSIGNNAVARSRVNKVTRLCFEFWLLITGLRVKVTGKKRKDRLVYVANHGAYIDDIIIFSAIRTHFRPLGKKEMSKIPLWGYLYRHSVVMVDRKSPESRARCMQEMADVLQGEGSILIFPEGTFNETGKPLKDFYDGAFRLAIATGTPIAPIIFPDAMDRAHYSAWWKIWPGRNRAFLLDPVEVAGLQPSDINSLKEQTYKTMERALIAANPDRNKRDN